jgi:hypothetical protein
MATSYKQAKARAEAPEFMGRVRMALARVAGDVVGEASGTALPGGGTVGSGTVRDKRHEHGVSVLFGLERDEYVRRYSYAVAVENAVMAVDQAAGTVTGDEVPDATIFANVRVLFHKFAGVKAGET